MIVALFALLLPLAAVWIGLQAWNLRLPHHSRTLTAVVAFGCAVGLSSLTTFWLMAHIGLIGGAFVAADAGLWLGAAALGLWRLRSARQPEGRSVGSHPRPGPAPITTADWLARVAFAIVAAVGLATVVAEYMAGPHGQWDAWAVWNQKARFLVRAGDQWTSSLVNPWSNPSHPVLVSTSVARLWTYAGAELTAVPALLALSFGVGVVACVIGALDPRRTRAWIAGAIVIAPAIFVQQASAQTADMPVGFFVTAALAVFLRMGADSDGATTGRFRDSSLLLGVMLASFAAWTKNEGLILTMLLLAATAWHALRGLDLWRLATVAAGAVPALVSIAWLKVALAPVPPGYFSESDGAATILERLVATERHAAVGSMVIDHWLRWGYPGGEGALPVITAALAIAAIAGRRAARATTAVVVVMFTGYYVSWLVSPLETQWLVGTSFDRLLIQLWPLMVIASFARRATGDPADGR